MQAEIVSNDVFFVLDECTHTAIYNDIFSLGLMCCYSEFICLDTYFLFFVLQFWPLVLLFTCPTCPMLLC